MNDGKHIINVLIVTVLLSISMLVVTNESKVPHKAVHVWTKADSKAYARDQLNNWAHKQYVCLASMWGKESAWKHTAINHEEVMGKFAGGIPQLLGMSPTTPPTIQIDRGLDYIYNRYGTPCQAWKFHQKNGWY